MFTGLVQGVGSVTDIARSPEGARITIATPLVAELSAGDSVAINGVCLTAVTLDDGAFGADAMNETLGRSSLGGLAPGSAVNLELPLRATDRLGGHVVQGHVDGLGEVIEHRDDGFARRIRIGAGPEVLRYVVEKGSIAVDGVSLTVTAVDERSFTVSLIPETLQRTNLGQLEAGSRVNLEVDVLAKYVEKLMVGVT
jgi:riboflavin synthase